MDSKGKWQLRHLAYRCQFHEGMSLVLQWNKVLTMELHLLKDGIILLGRVFTGGH